MASAVNLLKCLSIRFVYSGGTFLQCSVRSELSAIAHDILTPSNSQPIWTRRGICRSLAINLRLYGLSAQFLKLLGTVSYRFMDGPFHNSCVFSPVSLFYAPLSGGQVHPAGLRPPPERRRWSVPCLESAFSYKNEQCRVERLGATKCRMR